MARVFICSSRSLFSEGVKALLDPEPELEVVGWEADVAAAIQQVLALQPDAVLIITNSSLSQTVNTGQQFLRAGVMAKIVELDLDDSSVCIYQGAQQPIRATGDLVQAIELSLADSDGTEAPTRK